MRLSGVAIRIPFRTLMTQFPKKENGLPRRFAPRNDTLINNVPLYLSNTFPRGEGAPEGADEEWRQLTT